MYLSIQMIKGNKKNIEKIKFHVISLFPETLSSYIQESIVKRAQDKKLIDIKLYNLREFAPIAKNKKSTYSERRVDDKPYGGGPGMVIEAMPVISVISKILKKTINPKKVKIIFFSPSGNQWTDSKAQTFSEKLTDIILICGRYEGIDSRAKKPFKTEEISIGPYVLTGGEIPAMIVIDSITRRIPGVIGNILSLEDNRIASSEIYTRPETIIFNGKKYRVPKVFLSGNHKLIEERRLKKMGGIGENLK